MLTEDSHNCSSREQRLTRGEKVRESCVERLPNGGLGEHIAQVALGGRVVHHVGRRVLEVAEALPATSNSESQQRSSVANQTSTSIVYEYTNT